MYLLELVEGYELAIEESDQCFNCYHRIKLKCPLIDALTDLETVEFCNPEGALIENCKMYKPQALRVVK